LTRKCERGANVGDVRIVLTAPTTLALHIGSVRTGK
jgi:hypothetical protein